MQINFFSLLHYPLKYLFFPFQFRFKHKMYVGKIFFFYIESDVKHHKPKPIRVITKLPNSEQSYKGKVKTHNYINRQNQSTTGKL